mmetsp:Transcript_45677/g.82595  ORF Transcript_45677/g.82595 Transcript_45677/m.82595 type:complete len:193 (-) Transcript_45677:115-693(-)
MDVIAPQGEWRQFWSEEHGRFYYANAQWQTSWDSPPGVQIATQSTPHKKSAAADASTADRHASASSLPGGAGHQAAQTAAAGAESAPSVGSGQPQAAPDFEVFHVFLERDDASKQLGMGHAEARGALRIRFVGAGGIVSQYNKEVEGLPLPLSLRTLRSGDLITCINGQSAVPEMKKLLQSKCKLHMSVQRF